MFGNALKTTLWAGTLLLSACTSVAQGPAPAGASFTPPPSPTVKITPVPKTVYKIGEAVRYADGWQVTVTKSEDQPLPRFTLSTPAPGMRLVAVLLRFENGSVQPVSPNPFYFKLQDGVGVRRGIFIFGASRNDQLTSSELAPGVVVNGSIIFEAPVGDGHLSLIYEQYGYTQTTFELF